MKEREKTRREGAGGSDVRCPAFERVDRGLVQIEKRAGQRCGGRVPIGLISHEN